MFAADGLFCNGVLWGRRKGTPGGAFMLNLRKHFRTFDTMPHVLSTLVMFPLVFCLAGPVFANGTGKEGRGGPSPVVRATGFDHQHKAWDVLLRRHVKNGRVNYTMLSKKRQAVNAYLSSLNVDPKTFDGWRGPEKMAFWINAYNAYTIAKVLDHWPVKSIKDIGLTSLLPRSTMPSCPLANWFVDRKNASP